MSQQQHDETTMTQHTQTHNRRALSRYSAVVLFSKMENNHQNLFSSWIQWHTPAIPALEYKAGRLGKSEACPGTQQV